MSIYTNFSSKYASHSNENGIRPATSRIVYQRIEQSIGNDQNHHEHPSLRSVLKVFKNLESIKDLEDLEGLEGLEVF